MVEKVTRKSMLIRPSGKAEYIRQWTELHDEIIPWNKIRYIF